MDIVDIQPIMLRGLSWEQALASLRAVDCAVRRDHWCNPVVVLLGDQPVIDDDGEIHAFAFMDDDRSARDWSMVPRVNSDGDPIPLTYRAHLSESQS